MVTDLTILVPVPVCSAVIITSSPAAGAWVVVLRRYLDQFPAVAFLKSVIEEADETKALT
jgi:hypothetical protein